MRLSCINSMVWCGVSSQEGKELTGTQGQHVLSVWGKGVSESGISGYRRYWGSLCHLEMSM